MYPVQSCPPSPSPLLGRSPSGSSGGTSSTPTLSSPRLPQPGRCRRWRRWRRPTRQAVEDYEGGTSGDASKQGGATTGGLGATEEEGRRRDAGRRRLGSSSASTWWWHGPNLGPTGPRGPGRSASVQAAPLGSWPGNTSYCRVFFSAVATGLAVMA
jgi:hypothetical protein